MKNFFEFLKTCAQGGLFVVLPLLLLYLLVDELLETIIALATPIAEIFLPEVLEQGALSTLVALLLIFFVSFLFGLGLKSELVSCGWESFEGQVLGRVPLYNAVKALSRGLSSAEEEDGFRAALLHSADGTAEIVYLVEKINDQRAAVLVPWSPTSFAGSLKIVDANRLEMLTESVGEASKVLAHWGVGIKDLLADRDQVKQERSSIG